LATTGPYAHIRNPLYLGSFMLGAGVMVAGGQWVFGVAFLVLFLLVYRVTVLREAKELEARFGASYRTYAAQVPTVLPRITPYRAGDSDSLRGALPSRIYMRRRSERLRPSAYWL